MDLLDLRDTEVTMGHQDLRDLQAGLVCQVEMEHQEHQDLLV